MLVVSSWTDQPRRWVHDGLEMLQKWFGCTCQHWSTVINLAEISLCIIVTNAVVNVTQFVFDVERQSMVCSRLLAVETGWTDVLPTRTATVGLAKCRKPKYFRFIVVQLQSVCYHRCWNVIQTIRQLLSLQDVHLWRLPTICVLSA